MYQKNFALISRLEASTSQCECLWALRLFIAARVTVTADNVLPVQNVAFVFARIYFTKPTLVSGSLPVVQCSQTVVADDTLPERNVAIAFTCVCFYVAGARGRATLSRAASAGCPLSGERATAVLLSPCLALFRLPYWHQLSLYGALLVVAPPVLHAARSAVSFFTRRTVPVSITPC